MDKKDKKNIEFQIDEALILTSDAEPFVISGNSKTILAGYELDEQFYLVELDRKLHKKKLIKKGDKNEIEKLVLIKKKEKND